MFVCIVNILTRIAPTNTHKNISQLCHYFSVQENEFTLPLLPQDTTNLPSFYRSNNCTWKTFNKIRLYTFHCLHKRMYFIEYYILISYTSSIQSPTNHFIILPLTNLELSAINSPSINFQFHRKKVFHFSSNN